MKEFFKNILKKLRIDFSKNSKLIYYIKSSWIYFSPKFLYSEKLLNTYRNMSEKERELITNRVNYYNQLNEQFNLDQNTITVNDFIRKEKKKTYFFDLLEYLKYFHYNNKISYLFGDITTVPTIPTIVKSRPINEDNQNSIIMKLNKVRHFIFINDKINFKDKLNKAVWRGKCYVEHRQHFVQKFYNKEFCNIGQVNTKGKIDVPWQKTKLSLQEQLQYKFLIAIEGNDVASNLKWAMSSNSLVIMAKPKYETWFMEGTLIENYHYVLVKDDYSDLEIKIDYFSKNINEAEEIINNAHKYIKKFQIVEHENVISYLVLDKYFKKSFSKD